MDFKMVAIWGDGNITTALYWSQELGKCAALPTSLNNLEARAIFIDRFNQKYGGHIRSKYIVVNNERDGFIREVARFSKDLLPDLSGTDDEVASLVFKIWGACITTCKQIDVRRKIRPKDREKTFTTILDPYGRGDNIFLQGMETAVSYYKLKKEKYSLRGAPKDSPVRIRK